MSIRAKTTVFVLITFAVVVGLLAVLHVQSSLDRFGEIETELAVEDAGRVDRQLDSTLAGLAGINRDWAHWDASYEYIQDRNDGYRDENLYADALVPLGIDLTVYSDRSGSPAYAAWYTPDGDERPVPDELLSTLKPGGGMFGDFSDDTTASRTGIVKTVEGVFLVSSRAILRSDDSGEPRGVLLMAREVNESFITELASLTGLDLRMERCLDSCTESAEGPLVSRTGNTISTESTIMSAFGEPALRVNVDGDRSIYRESVAGVSRVLLIVIGVGLVAALATIAGIHTLVIRRLRRLGQTVDDIARSDDPSLRAEVRGNDEITRLAEGTNTMLSRLEKSRNDLVAAKRSVDQASEAKSRFLSHMSHEIRTPLNAVLAHGQLLQMDAVDDEAKESSDQIVRAAGHVTELLEEFLDIARIEAGAIPLQLDDVDVATVVGDAVDLSRPLAADAGTSIDYVSDGECLATADAMRLKQVVLNLVSNAVKYGGDGPITVRTERADAIVSVEVTDRGPGILEGLIDRLFIPFDRLEADQGSRQGTGIGLAVCKQLVELMHGTITVTSEVGLGSTFTVELPAAASAVGEGSEAVKEHASA